jgi:hypothetical protein
MEEPWKADKIMALRVLISPASAAGHAALSPSPHRAGHSRDATQPPIEPADVTAGHVANTNLSPGGLQSRAL